MSDAVERMTALAGGTLTEAIGPITVNSLNLYGYAPVGWGTALDNVRSLSSGGGSPNPIIFAAGSGQLSIIAGASLDWMFYCRFTANWPADRAFQWNSDMAGNGPAQGRVDPIANSSEWYFSTPPIGPDGELVVTITATGAQAPDDAFDVSELNFWLFC